MKRTKEKKTLNKYDRVCKFCKQIIKGALRETTEKGDFEGTICSDRDDNYWHRNCEDEKNTIKKDREEKQRLAEV